jgi:hypothetical protein
MKREDPLRAGFYRRDSQRLRTGIEVRQSQAARLPGPNARRREQPE